MNIKTAAALVADLLVFGLVIYSHQRSAAPAPIPAPTNSSPVRPAFKPHRPAPPLPARAPSVEAALDDSRPTNVLARLLNPELPRLNLQQVESYLAQNRRNADSLLAAYRATEDPTLLHEALEKSTNDPRVNFVAYFALTGNPDLSSQFPPEERRRQLEAFKQSAPDNALPNYLSALDYFKADQTDPAVEELMAAASRPQFQDYSLDLVQNAEEAYRSAGYSEAEAKTAADGGLPLPQLAQLKQLSLNMADLAQAYRRMGDEASAQATLQIGLNLGQRLDAPQAFSLMQNLVGTAIQRNLLATLDPNSAYGNAGQTVQNQLDTLAQRSASLKADLPIYGGQPQPMGVLLGNLSEQDLISFYDRCKFLGQAAALQWMVSKQGKP
jgi:hypothetical protein